METHDRVDRNALNTVADGRWRVVGMADCLESAGIGDFDADGMDDIFWNYPTTGANSIWLLNGVERKSRHFVPRSSIGWRAFGVSHL